MHEGQHGRTLVGGRINPSHQLPGVTGGLSSSQNLRKHSEGPDSPENGQYFSSDIHKSEGRYSLNSTVQSSFGSLGMVPPEAINNPSRTSTRKPQFACGLRVQNDEGSVRLADKSNQQIQQSLGPLQIDLFASRLTKQLPTTTAGGQIQKQKRQMPLPRTGPKQEGSQTLRGV